MMRKIYVSLFFVLPYFVQAQGFQVNLQGQKQQAMAGAGTGLMQDAAAVFFNPGGVSFLKENSVTAGATATIAHSTFLDADNNSLAHSNAPVSTPFTVYAVWGTKDTSGILSKLKFGLGVYTPFGSVASWENGWTGRFALTYLSLQAIFIQPTVSYKICEKLGFGAGFVYATGNMELKQDMPVIDANGNYGSADLKGSATGYGYNAGLYYRPCDKLSVGLSYRSQVNMSVTNGTATFTVPPSLASNFPSGPFSSSLKLPQVATLGFGYHLNEKLTLALDINFIGWKCLDTLAFHYKTTTASLQDTKLPRDYHNTYAFRLGAQYKLNEQMTARVGIAYALTPISAGFVTPEIPDANKVTYAAGLGYKANKHFILDVSYIFESLKRTDNNQALNLNGTYKTYISAPGLSLIYQF
jgi:long-chain fatty acid transport protein